MNAPAPNPLADRLDAALPQTQCTRCGYADCAAYAHAIASGEAAINQCPPGGAEGIKRLASITGLPARPLNLDHGREAPRAVAVIDEAWCIGCTLCLKACPVDAIMGSNKLMHTVLEAYCTGCELCVPACPVDCISMENVTGTRTGWDAWSAGQAQTSRVRYAFHSKQMASQMRSGIVKPAIFDPSGEEPDSALPALPTTPALPTPSEPLTSAAERKRVVIAAALARARGQRKNGA